MRRMTVTTVQFSEAIEAAPVAVEGKAGRFRILVINEGFGSSGLYSKEVLRAAAERNVWPKGLQVYLDHPGENESWDRPERTVRDLIGALETDGVWDDNGPEGPGVYAEMRVYSSHAAWLKEAKDDVGMSIRGYMIGEYTEVPGGAVFEITELVAMESVDVVTKAGRGGAIVEVLESARISDAPEDKEVRALLESRAKVLTEHGALRTAPAPVTSPSSKPSERNPVMADLTAEGAASLKESIDALNGTLSSFVTVTQERAAAEQAAAEAAKANEPTPVEAAFALTAALAESGLGKDHLPAVQAFMATGQKPTEAIESVKAIVKHDAAPARESAVPSLHIVEATESGSGSDGYGDMLDDLNGAFGYKAKG